MTLTLAPMPLAHAPAADPARLAQPVTERLPEPPVSVAFKQPAVEPGGEFHVRWYCERAL